METNKTVAQFLVILLIAIHSSFSLPFSPGGNGEKLEGTSQKVSTEYKRSAHKKNNASIEDRVVYSYSEAIVKDDGAPSVSQMTIVKGKDGEVRYAKKENGTVETGKWDGPIPSPPHIKMTDPTKMFEKQMHEMFDEVADPLAKLNENIGNTLQDYFNKAFSFF